MVVAGLEPMSLEPMSLELRKEPNMVQSQDPQPPNPPIQVYDSEAVQLFGYIRVSRVEVVPDQGGGDLVEVRADTDSDALWKSLRWHCRQDDAPKAGEVFQLLIVKPDYLVRGADAPQAPPEEEPE